MYRKIWKECHQSVCSIHFLSRSSTCITTFTGFKVRDYLVTHDFRDKYPDASEILIHFPMEDGNTELASKRMSYQDLVGSILNASSSKDHGFLVLNINGQEFSGVPSLQSSRRIRYEIGHPVAVLGYQLEQENLSIMRGIISSLFSGHDGVNYMLIDSPIRQGNAGSPVIDTETLEVIGVIGHSLATMSKSYKEMIRIINKNLSMLKEVEGKISLGEIDPIQVLMASQNQIKHIVNSFYKYITRGVGFAAELCTLVDLCPETEDASYFEMKSDTDE